MEETIPYHPRQCHLCKYDGVNALLAKRGLPLCEEAERACLACRFPGESHGGASWVSIDAAAKPESVYSRRLAPLYRPGGKPDAEKLDTPCGPAERERHLRFLQTFAELSWDDAGMVACLLRGEGLAEVAKARGVAYETAFARWQKLKAANPAFAALANGLMGTGRGRKRKTAEQGELFKEA